MFFSLTHLLRTIERVCFDCKRFLNSWVYCPSELEIHLCQDLKNVRHVNNSSNERVTLNKDNEK